MYKTRSGYFKTLIISNLAILLISAVMAATLTRQYGAVIYDNSREVNRMILEQTRSTTDTIISTLDTLALNISMNENISAMTHPDRFTRTEYISESSRIIEALSGYIKAYPYLESICLYYKNSGMVVTNNSRFLSVEDFMFYSADAHWTQSEFLSLIEEGQKDKHIGSRLISSAENRTQKSVFTMVFPLKIASSGQSHGCAIVSVDNDYIREFAGTNRVFSKSIIFARNTQGNIMFQFGTPNHFDAIDRIDFGAPSGLVSIPFGEDTLIVSQIASEVNDWTYWSVIEEDSFVRNFSFTAMLFIAAIILVSGSILAVYLAIRNSEPVRETFNAVRNQFLPFQLPDAPPPGGTINELEVIRSLTAKAASEYRVLSDRLLSHIHVIRAGFIRSLLHGSHIGEKSKEDLALLGVSLPYSHYAVIIFHYDWKAAFSEDYSYYHAKLRISAERELALPETPLAPVYLTDMDEYRIAALLNGPKSFDGLETELRMACGAVIDGLGMAPGETISVSIGKSVDSLPEVRTSWLTADRALQGRLISAPGGVTYYGDISKAKEQYYYPIELENRLIEAVCSGDSAGMHMIIDDVIVNNFEGNGLSPEAMRCLLFNLLGTAIRVKNALPSQSVKLHTQVYQDILSLTSIQDAEVATRAAFEELCGIVAAMREKNADTLGRISAHIESHYGDPGLSLISVAEAVGLNANYLSTYFKENLGDRFSVYVNKLRIGKAANLLENGNISVDKVSELVGYSSSNVFIRNFKRFTGHTPGDFRKRRKLTPGV